MYQMDIHDSYFISGSNHAGEIKGLALSGCHIGVSVNALDKAGKAIAELEMLAHGGTKVFVDSGAFGEVRFDKAAGKFVDVKPITDAEWEKRIAVYEKLAPVLRSQLYIVAPDKVGNQTETLCRLERYAERIKTMALRYGVNVIVPIQNGETAAIEFDRCVREIFDMTDVADDLVDDGQFYFIRGIPSAKGATTAKQLSESRTRLARWSHRASRGAGRCPPTHQTVSATGFVFARGPAHRRREAQESGTTTKETGLADKLFSVCPTTTLSKPRNTSRTRRYVCLSRIISPAVSTWASFARSWRGAAGRKTILPPPLALAHPMQAGSVAGRGRRWTP
jgi:hypothetical protein